MSKQQRNYRLSKRPARKIDYQDDLHNELEKIIQQQVKSFEEQVQNIANNMQKKILNELSHKLSEQMIGSIANGGILQDALGKTLQQSISSLGGSF